MIYAIFLVVVCVTSLADSQEVNVTKMQETILRLEASVGKLVGSVEELNTSREDLVAENKEQALKIKQLEHKVSRKVEVLRGMGLESLDRATENGISISEITEQVSNLKRFESAVTHRVSNLERRDGEVVAFSTHLSGDTIEPTSYTDIIVPFNNIITNIGGHFSSHRHKFRCPVDGFYMFHYTIYSSGISQSGRDETNAKLVKDGVEVNSVRCGTDTEEAITCQVSNSAVVRCGRNSDVYVVTWGSSTRIYAGLRRTTFSGFLIKSI